MMWNSQTIAKLMAVPRAITLVPIAVVSIGTQFFMMFMALTFCDAGTFFPICFYHFASYCSTGRSMSVIIVVMHPFPEICFVREFNLANVIL